MMSRREAMALSAAALLQSRQLSPVELTKSCLDRIAMLNSRLNAFITVTADDALAQAKRAEAELTAGKSRGPWHGVPIGLKDLYDTAGVHTTAGSKQWADRVPTKDAAVVGRLKAAGAVILGKLNMDEFAYNFTGETSAFGTARNPWDPARSPGGSSGGSAVAVATGMCLGALGSDTGGSIRLPAALCGITGFKPTYGIVSAEGVAPLAWSLDHVGPMCRSASEAASMLEILTGKPGSTQANIAALRLGVPRELFYVNIDTEVAKCVAEATARLRRLTAGVRDVPLPQVAYSTALPFFIDAYVTVISAEAYAFHESMLKARPDRYHPGTRKSIEGGAAFTAAQYIRAKHEMDRMRAEAERWFAGTDMLITPTAPGPAFRFGEGNLVFLRNTAPWNLLGLPTVSIPCGFTKSGLPVGLQITGRAGQDHSVLALAAAYQKESDWHTRRPPTSGEAPTPQR